MRKWFCVLISVMVLTVFSLSALAADEAAAPVVGSWKLDKVYENASSDAPVELDPENAASLYSETSNVYSFYADGTADLVQSEAGETYVLSGSWTGNEDGVVLNIEDDPGMALSFDKETNTLHRSWKDENPDAMYKDLDFVYVKLPVGVFRLQQVFSVEDAANPVLLDPANAASLYGESEDVYYFLNDGTAVVMMPEDYNVEGTWTLDGSEFVLTEADGDVMTFTYDAVNDVLHRSFTEDASEAEYKALDFVYQR